MIIPDISCKIHVSAQIHPSEDPEKIKSAMLNIVPFIDVVISEGMIHGHSTDIHSLGKIHESIQSKQTSSAYKRQLQNNSNDNQTWIYLNKQAAFVDNIALCKEEDESPLGPIQINIDSNDIRSLIGWMIYGNNYNDIDL